MKCVRIICVGKLKTDFWKTAAAHYMERISRMRSILITEVKDCPTGSIQNRIKAEGKLIIDCLAPTDKAFALDEHGVQINSVQFASMIENEETGKNRLCFIIGGPFGLSGEVLGQCKRSISLSPLTWPHELARVMLLEQIYRAECIARKIPYHHE